MMSEAEAEIEVDIDLDKDLSPSQTNLCNLPDEILENIFTRLNPYSDLEAIKISCKRFYSIVQKVISNLMSNFEENLITGRLITTVKLSPRVDPLGQIVPPGSWAMERFGHMACYYDKCVYILGGTTHTPTTFNDMWKFNLRTDSWTRVLASGQYPTPKALASSILYKDNFIIFGGWSHPSPYPLMQPWRIFDELHIYNFTSNKWSLMLGSTKNPFPTAGHSASIKKDKMIIFGGRIFDQNQQSYPLSDSVWVYDFSDKEWNEVRIVDGGKPQARYGHTQISLEDDNSLIIIGGCGGPNQVFSDVWLLTILEGGRRGKWERIRVSNQQEFTANEFHYHGCKVGNSVIFLERTSSISPFLAFLQYDAHPEQQNIHFEPSRQRHFHSRCTSGLRGGAGSLRQSIMSIYSLDISQVLSHKTAQWIKEDKNNPFPRPNERLLYSMVQGRAELILFGGFYKDSTSSRCRVSSDVFRIKQVHKSY